MRSQICRAEKNRPSSPLLALVVLTAVITGTVHPAQAQTPALEFASPSVAGTYGFSVLVGWAFTVNATLTVTDLGAPFDFQGGGGDLPTQLSVGLWDGAGALLASTVVTNTDTLAGNFRYRTVTPVNIAPGQTYTVAALYHPNEKFISSASGEATAPQVTYVQARFQDSATLVRPTTASTFFGTTDGEFGGTFRFQVAAPEPSAFALLAFSAVPFVAAIRRSRGRS